MRVRIFGYRGMEQLKINIPKYFTSETVFQLVQPYEWAQALVTAGAAPQSSAAQAVPDLTQILRVEVPDGQAIRYEINPPGRNVAAGSDSPILSGINMFYFRQGYVISIIDAAGT